MPAYKSFTFLVAAAQFAVGASLILAEPAASSVERRSDAPIRIWTAVFVDATTKTPLEGILVDANLSFSNKKEMQDNLLTSDASGKIRISLRKGECTFLNVRGPRWCYASGFPVVGELPAEWTEGRPSNASPEKPITFELHRGTEVKGRLLRPDGKPAAGVSLSAGTHCNQPPWVSEEYINNLTSHTFSVSEWPNWNVATQTEEDGSFSVTVPPGGTRGWIRLGTAQGGWSPIDTSTIEKSNKEHVLVRFAPFEVEVNGEKSPRQVDETTGVVDLGDLRLSKGIVLRGRVEDADGRPMQDVRLLTSCTRGPYAGRSTSSKSDGTFEFMPMNAGAISLSPDAHVRDEKNKIDTRDVRAVFLPQEIALSGDVNPREVVVRALPHVEVEFEWIDRRAEKGPVSFYGGFTLYGRLDNGHGKSASWIGDTVEVSRGGKKLLVVKVPKSVTALTIGLHPDDRVTPSYSDDLAQNKMGQVELGDFNRKMRRVIFGDEPEGKK